MPLRAPRVTTARTKPHRNTSCSGDLPSGPAPIEHAPHLTLRASAMRVFRPKRTSFGGYSLAALASATPTAPTATFAAAPLSGSFGACTREVALLAADVAGRPGWARRSHLSYRLRGSSGSGMARHRLGCRRRSYGIRGREDSGGRGGRSRGA